VIITKTIIFASTEDGAIGLNNDIPWKMRSDMQFFKKTTTSGEVNHLVMGRKTFESMGSKALPNRIMHVVSRTPENIKKAKDVYAYKSIEQAIESIDNIAKLSDPAISVWIIGGASIYQQCIDIGLVNKAIQTIVHGNIKGDTFFSMPEEGWVKSEPIKYLAGDRDDHPYSIVTWMKL